MKLELVQFEVNHLDRDLKEGTSLSDYMRAYRLKFIKPDNNVAIFSFFFNYLIDIYDDNGVIKKNISFDIIYPENDFYYDFSISKREKNVNSNKFKIIVDNDEITLKKINKKDLGSEKSIDIVLKELKDQIIKERYESLSLFKNLDITYDGEPLDINDDSIKDDFEQFSNFIDCAYGSLYDILKKEIVEYENSHFHSSLNKKSQTIKKNKL